MEVPVSVGVVTILLVLTILAISPVIALAATLPQAMSPQRVTISAETGSAGTTLSAPQAQGCLMVVTDANGATRYVPCPKTAPAPRAPRHRFGRH
jgi:hypothetical protein